MGRPRAASRRHPLPPLLEVCRSQSCPPGAFPSGPGGPAAHHTGCRRPGPGPRVGGGRSARSAPSGRSVPGAATAAGRGTRGTQSGGSPARHGLQFPLPFPVAAWEGGGGQSKARARLGVHAGTARCRAFLAGAAPDRRDARRRAGGSACVRVRECVCVSNTKKAAAAAWLRSAAGGWPSSVRASSLRARTTGAGKGARCGAGCGGGDGRLPRGRQGGRFPGASGRAGPDSQTKPTASGWQPVPGRRQPLGKGAAEDSAGAGGRGQRHR